MQMCNTVVRRSVHATATQPSPAASTVPGTPASQGGDQQQSAVSIGGSDAAHAELNSQADTALAARRSADSGSRPAGSPSAESQPARGSETRTAQLFAMAEQRDFVGLEAAIEGIPAAAPTHNGQPAGSAAADPSADAHVAASAADGAASSDGPSEEASHGPLQHVDAFASREAQQGAPSVPRLDVLEADVIAVLAALCRLAARQAAPAQDEAAAYVLAGKHLAADVLLRVLESRGNPWHALSRTTWGALRQPFCMVLLRCADRDGPDYRSSAAAPRLFAAVLTRTPLRQTLKAEMGAFLPLLLLRPLEAEHASPEAIDAALAASLAVAGAAQLMVDLFVNYDCDLQAVNVFERWVSALQRHAQPPEQPAQRPHAASMRQALTCISTALTSLSDWMANLEAQRPDSAEHASAGQRSSAGPQEMTFEVRAALFCRAQSENACTGAWCPACTPEQLQWLIRACDSV